MAEFYSAHGREIPPLLWTILSPPFSNLTGEDWIIYGAGEGRRIIFEQTFEQVGLVLPDSSLESNAFTFAIRYMETTNAISLLPEHIFQHDNAYKGLVPLDLSDNFLKWKVAAVTRSNSVNSLATNAFVAAFKEIFRS
ncbi:MAG: LysR family transcriptional regulator substrate-binding protein [Rhodospirillaceae bacterium]|nr:LysR family transcriptional regulator substrate-binding protein [Rhodospirillaceae bacterium]